MNVKNTKKNHAFRRMRTRTELAILVTVTSAVIGVGFHTHTHTHTHTASPLARLYLDFVSEYSDYEGGYYGECSF